MMNLSTRRSTPLLGAVLLAATLSLTSLSHSAADLSLKGMSFFPAKSAIVAQITLTPEEKESLFDQIKLQAAPKPNAFCHALSKKERKKLVKEYKKYGDDFNTYCPSDLKEQEAKALAEFTKKVDDASLRSGHSAAFGGWIEDPNAPLSMENLSMLAAIETSRELTTEELFTPKDHPDILNTTTSLKEPLTIYRLGSTTTSQAAEITDGEEKAETPAKDSEFYIAQYHNWFLLSSHKDIIESAIETHIKQNGFLPSNPKAQALIEQLPPDAHQFTAISANPKLMPVYKLMLEDAKKYFYIFNRLSDENSDAEATCQSNCEGTENNTTCEETTREDESTEASAAITENATEPEVATQTELTEANSSEEHNDESDDDDASDDEGMVEVPKQPLFYSYLSQFDFEPILKLYGDMINAVPYSVIGGKVSTQAVNLSWLTPFDLSQIKDPAVKTGVETMLKSDSNAADPAAIVPNDTGLWVSVNGLGHWAEFYNDFIILPGLAKTPLAQQYKDFLKKPLLPNITLQDNIFPMLYGQTIFAADKKIMAEPTPAKAAIIFTPAPQGQSLITLGKLLLGDPSDKKERPNWEELIQSPITGSSLICPNPQECVLTTTNWQHHYQKQFDPNKLNSPLALTPTYQAINFPLEANQNLLMGLYMDADLLSSRNPANAESLIFKSLLFKYWYNPNNNLVGGSFKLLFNPKANK